MSRANAAAFPSLAGDNGITIREHFAGLAMQALIGTTAAPCLVGGLGGAEHECAKGAVLMAEALIAELAKPVQP